MTFCIVNQSTWLSEFFVDCPPELVKANTPEGCVAVEAKGIDAGNYLYENEALIPIGEPPSHEHVYKRGTGWVVDAKPNTVKANVRSERNELLASSDWRVTKAQETGQAVPPAWQAYRQALRDITEQPGFPYDVDWPQEPTE